MDYGRRLTPPEWHIALDHPAPLECHQLVRKLIASNALAKELGVRSINVIMAWNEVSSYV